MCVVITGVAGGIGQALVCSFVEAGYSVIGSDVVACPEALPCEHFIQADLQQTVTSESYAAGIFASIRKAINGRPLTALINNAAVQILYPVESLSRAAWRNSIDINLLAPFLWTQSLLSELERANGCVLNMSSIHARLTKPNFVAYATSKAALSGMTRAMAVELGSRIRVNAIEPAAIETSMLRASFATNSAGYDKLQQFHPTRQVGSPAELAALALLVVQLPGSFANGSIIAFDGGIGGLLHDPGDLHV